MNPLQQCKFVPLVEPTAIVDNASWTSAVIDTLGWSYATLVFRIGVTDIAMAALKVQESDDNSTYTDVTGADWATNTNTDMGGTALALPSATADNSFRFVHLDMTKHKRYLQCVATAGDGTNGTYMAAIGILSKPHICPNTQVEQGGTGAVGVIA